MLPSAYLLDHLHGLVYEQTGWALPDIVLHQVAALVPADLQARASDPEGRMLVRAWVKRAQAQVLAVVSQVQEGDVMYA